MPSLHSGDDRQLLGRRAAVPRHHPAASSRWDRPRRSAAARCPRSCPCDENILRTARRCGKLERTMIESDQTWNIPSHTWVTMDMTLVHMQLHNVCVCVICVCVCVCVCARLGVDHLQTGMRVQVSVMGHEQAWISQIHRSFQQEITKCYCTSILFQKHVSTF